MYASFPKIKRMVCNTFVLESHFKIKNNHQLLKIPCEDSFDIETLDPVHKRSRRTFRPDCLCHSTSTRLPAFPDTWKKFRDDDDVNDVNKFNNIGFNTFYTTSTSLYYNRS